MNVSSSANSFAERWTSASPRQACRVAGIQPQVAHLEHRRALDRATPHQRPQPCEELGERERLRQVVVGPRIETRDAVVDRVARGEHEHRCPDAVLADPAADLEAVDAGEHQVEHDRVVLGRLRHPDRVVARARDVDRVTLLDEPAPEQARHLELVLDDQDPHAACHCRTRDETQMRGASHDCLIRPPYRRQAQSTKEVPMKKLVTVVVLVIVTAAVAAGIAIGAGGRDEETPITGTTLTRASEAALAHTKGGRVSDTEAGDEEGAYEVEVTLADGTQVDVHLDADFNVLGEEPDSDSSADED